MIPGSLISTLVARIVDAFDPHFRYVSLRVNADRLLTQKNVYANSTIVDTSGSAFAFTRTGNPTPGTFSPFPVTSLYSPSVNGGSIYFNGTTDYTYTATAAVGFGTSDFTIEAWVNPTSIGTIMNIVSNTAASGASGIQTYISTNGKLGVSTATTTLYGGVTAIVANVWTHVAFIRTGGNIKAYINGVLDNTYGNATNFTDAVPFIAGALGTTGGQLFKGYISDLRVINGTALYTANFIRPAGPLTAIPKTTLLINGTSAGVMDYTGKNTVLTNSAAAVSPNVIKYGTGSLKFTGASSDYLSIPPTNLDITTGDFTVEFWFNTASVATATAAMMTRTINNLPNYGTFAICTSTTNATVWLSSVSNGWNIANQAVFGTGLVANTWYHVALVRSGSTFTAYLNGVGTVVGTSAAALYNPGTPYFVGAVNSAVPANFFTGYIRDVRITKAARYTSTFTPPSDLIATIEDANFGNTALLLKGNIVQTTLVQSTNKTVFDNSPSNLTLTAVGSPAQGSVTPFGNNWSGNFNGSTDYITVPANASFAPAGDFTIELFAYFNSITVGAIIRNYTAADSTNWGMALNAGVIQVYTNGSTLRLTTSVVTGKWYHLALVRSGSTITLYKDGVSAGTYAQSGVFGDNTKPIVFGVWNGTVEFLNGYISNARIVNGTAVYTSNFIPATTPLTAISGTSLLTLQSNRIVDVSTNASILTLTGTPSIQPNSPFSAYNAYNPVASGGSVYFNGTTDNLVSSASTALQVGTNDFTIEAWVNTSSTGGVVCDICSSGTAGNTNRIAVTYGTDPAAFGVYSGSAMVVTASVTLFANMWHHVAVVRAGNTINLYANGAAVGSATFSNNISNNICTIGAGYGGGSRLNGFISNVRILNGTALYTGAFTPPTSPLAAIAKTVLLMQATNPGIVDYAGKSNLITNGTSKITNTISKYGDGSIALNGTSDYLTIPASPNNQFTGDFTIEMWIYPTYSATNNDIIGNYVSNTAADWMLLMGANNADFQFYKAGSATFLTTPAAVNTWYHIAIVRSGSTLTMYKNGTVTQSVAFTATMGDSTRPMRIGCRNGTAGFFAGYIDDLRITNGYARYTANFTPPTQPLLTK